MSIQLEIMVPDVILIETPVISLSAADNTGRFGVLPHRQKFVTLLVPCVIAFTEKDGHERYAAADGGVLLIGKDRVSVVTREAVIADQLEDVADAVESMLIARHEQEAIARTEFAGLRARLLRDLAGVQIRD